jgi:predicted RNase H-like HicB family nuclease
MEWLVENNRQGSVGSLIPTQYSQKGLPVGPEPRRRRLMTSTLSVPLEIIAVVHEIEGGGYWAEVTRFPGCVAQAETIEALKENILQAVEDWLSGSPVKTEDEAKRLAEMQGSAEPIDETFPQPYGYCPPRSWVDEDE